MRAAQHGRILHSMIVCGLIVAAASCSKSQKQSGKSYEDYPEFKEGGTMTLTMDGQPYTIHLSDIQFANTDGDYPDYVEVTGNETRILFECKKDFDLDFDGENAYDPIVNAPLPAGNLGFDEEELTLNLPGLGVFTVSSGSLTVLKYQIGRDGRDWWDGKISLTIESDQGQKTLPGDFSWCIVPVW